MTFSLPCFCCNHSTDLLKKVLLFFLILPPDHSGDAVRRYSMHKTALERVFG